MNGISTTTVFRLAGVCCYTRSHRELIKLAGWWLASFAATGRLGKPDSLDWIP